MALKLVVEKPPGAEGAVHLPRDGDPKSPLPQPGEAAGSIDLFQLLLFTPDAFEVLRARPDMARDRPSGSLRRGAPSWMTKATDSERLRAPSPQATVSAAGPDAPRGGFPPNRHRPLWPGRGTERGKPPDRRRRPPARGRRRACGGNRSGREQRAAVVHLGGRQSDLRSGAVACQLHGESRCGENGENGTGPYQKPQPVCPNRRCRIRCLKMCGRRYAW